MARVQPLVPGACGAPSSSAVRPAAAERAADAALFERAMATLWRERGLPRQLPESPVRTPTGATPTVSAPTAVVAAATTAAAEAEAEAEAAPELEDAELFRQAMADVARPQARPSRLPAPRPSAQARPVDDEQLALAELQACVGGDGGFAVHDGDAPLEGRAPGVNLRLLEMLRRGRFAYGRWLDLHGLVREEAHADLAAFILRARRDDERCVLVITGRGRSSPGGVPVLREALPRWLGRAPIRPHVLAFCTARPADGGAGAFYVLLRRAGVPPFGGPA